MKLSLKKKKTACFWAFFILLAFVTRLVGLNWGEGYFFHPDEGNMARSIAQMKVMDLNPRFFAYGQFPLYLVFFSAKFLNLLRRVNIPMVTFSQAVYWLRFYSAVFSLGTVIFGYLLIKKLEPKKKNNWLLILWLFLSPGLIQAAYFGTTESLLSFVALGLVYFSLEILEKGLTKRNTFLIALISGIGLGSKVSAALFLLPVMASFFLRFKKEKKKFIYLGKGFGLGLLSLFFFVLFCPYYLLEWQESLRIVCYEAQLASGQSQVFYTRQFLDTFPFLFQLKKVFPWVLGGVVFILALIALGTNFYLLFAKKKKKRLGQEWWLFHLGWLPWFLVNSFLFTKWVRFMVPILPFFIILSFWLASKLKNQKVFYLVIFLGAVPGLVFSKIYWTKDIRVKAMEWINENIPTGSVIFYEGGNIVDLPNLNHQDFITFNFDFHSLEENKENQRRLEEEIARADYFLSLSRRIFANRSKKHFPYTANFYEKLFSGELGFIKLKEFKVFSNWEEVVVGADLNSEETWTVFDHPTLRLYKRVEE